MLDRIYECTARGMDAIMENQRVRRRTMAICLSVPFGLMLWNPPWFLDAYLLAGGPLLVIGFALALVDMSLWHTKREDLKAAAKADKDTP